MLDADSHAHGHYTTSLAAYEIWAGDRVRDWLSRARREKSLLVISTQGDASARLVHAALPLAFPFAPRERDVRDVQRWMQMGPLTSSTSSSARELSRVEVGPASYVATREHPSTCSTRRTANV